MVICFDGHCYEIVIIPWPWTPWRPGPGPVNFPQLLRDATVIASLQAAAANAADADVREALLAGTQKAVEALQRRAGGHVTIRAEMEKK
jgi:hypothetical protein